MSPQKIPDFVVQAVRINEDVQRALRPLDLAGWQRATAALQYDFGRASGLTDQVADFSAHVRQSSSSSYLLGDAVAGRERLQQQLLSVRPAVEALSTVLVDLAPHRHLIEQARGVAQEFVRTYERALPASWRNLGDDEVDQAISLATESGLCLVWAPREAVVVELVAAKDDRTRAGILVSNRAPILDDVAVVLEATTHYVSSAHADAADLARKALAAATDEHDEAAQSLAAAALGLILHEVMGFERLGAAYKELSKRDVEEIALTLLRLTVIELAIARALTNTEAHTTGFNRHGTLHGKREFFSAADCLAALLLVTAWLREYSWWQEHHPDRISDDEESQDD